MRSLATPLVHLQDNGTKHGDHDTRHSRPDRSMRHIRFLLTLAPALLVGASCAGSNTPTPVATPYGNTSFLVPRRTMGRPIGQFFDRGANPYLEVSCSVPPS